MARGWVRTARGGRRGGRARLFDVVWPNASTPRDADADPAALPDRCELILRATLTVGRARSSA